MQEVGTLAHAVELGARRRVHVLRHVCTCAHKDGVVACTEQTVDGYIVLAHHAVGDKLHAEGSNLSHLIAYYRLRQAILRNTVHQHASRLSLALENGDVEPLTRQIAGYGQTRWTRTDDCHAATCFLWQHLARKVHLGIKIGNKLLQFADLYRFSFLSEHAVALTLFLMRAYTATDGRQVALGIDDAHRRTHVTHREFVYEIWNVVTNRASLLALRNLAVEAAFSLLNGLAGRKTLVHYLEGSSIHLLFSCIILFCSIGSFRLLHYCFCCILTSGLCLCSILHIFHFFLFTHNRTALLFY